MKEDASCVYLNVVVVELRMRTNTKKCYTLGASSPFEGAKE